MFILLTGLGMFLTTCSAGELNLNSFNLREISFDNQVVTAQPRYERYIIYKFQQTDYHLKFERLELVRHNKNFFKEPSIVTFKFNRTTALVNSSYTLIRDVGNDLVTIIQAYKFMSNEYRTFPMRFAADACKALAVNTFGIRELMACGNFTECPVMKGKYHFCNWSPDQSKFPPSIPNGEYKLELQFLHSSVEIGVVNLYVTISRPVEWI